MLNINKKLMEETKKWILSKRINKPINVTLTEKQSFNGIKLDNIISEQNFRHFKNVLNKKIFGNSYKRFNKQLQMLVVREESPNLRHHLHLIIEQPNRYTFYGFKKLIEILWTKTDFEYSKVHIEKPTDLNREIGWYCYIMKSNCENSIDWNNTVLH